jgi:acetolactate synthase-1/2/3 large subunit
MRLQGDARETLLELAEALASRDLSKRTDARPAVEQRVAEAWRSFERDRAELAHRDVAPLRPERVMTAIQDFLDSETIITGDASYASNWIVGQLRTITAGTRILTPGGPAGHGYGFPLAIGAKLARPSAKVIAVVGDAGFGHAWAELETVVRHNLPLTVIVLNNGVLGYQRDARQARFGRPSSSVNLGCVDHAAIARACGGVGRTVNTAADLDIALGRAMGSKMVTVLDVITDPAAHPPISRYDCTLDGAMPRRVSQAAAV